MAWSAKSLGHPTPDGIPFPEGAPSRIARTGASARLSTTALVNWVVPSEIKSSRSIKSGWRSVSMSSAFKMLR